MTSMLMSSYTLHDVDGQELNSFSEEPWVIELFDVVRVIHVLGTMVEKILWKKEEPKLG